MEKYYEEPTRITPEIKFDPELGILDFKGRSSPENAVQFYSRVIYLLDDYAMSEAASLIANFNFDYFNTSSSKCLFDVFRRLDKVERMGKELVINWYYEEDDEDMLEAGEDYCDLLGLDFNFIELEEEW
ncbi:MAG: DUF1987 domain-containing protein [Cyclobacteriaceae bacterium]